MGITATGDGPAVEPDSSTFTPAGIPCYTTGPFVKVFYGYASGSTNRYATKLPAIREAIARADDIYARSAAKYGGVRHVRWLMTPACKLSVTAVKFPTDAFNHAQPAWFFSNLVSRGLISRSQKGVILMDTDEGGGLTQRNGRDTRPGQNNTDNFGGTMSLVFGGSWDLSGYFYGGWVTAHELTHAMGAVNSSAPHYNTAISPGHCSDGDDVMCRDSPGSVCPRSLTGLLDCNGDDYFNPNPPAGSYLRTHWNTANNRFLARTAPAKWDRLDRPIVKITSPGAGQISGTADIRISVTPPAGRSIGNVALYGNGFDLGADPVGTSLTHYTLSTIPTEDTGGLPSSGFRNDQILDLSATAWDDIDRAQDSAAVRVTVSNPQIRLVRPTPDQPVSGTFPWEVVAQPEKGGSITRVQILSDGSVLATDTSAPYAGTIDLSGNDGPVEIQARVTTASGLTRLTRPRVIDVAFDPIVRLLSPLEATDSVLPKAVVRLVAEVEERSAIATKVEFLVDGAVVGTDTTAPYSVDWDDRTATAGEHVVRARATLAGGALHVSAPATVDLWAPGGSASVTSPAEGASISQPTPLVVAVTPPAGATIDGVTTQFGDLAPGPGGTWTGELDPFGAPLGRAAIVPLVSWTKGAESGTFLGRARLVRLRGPAGVTASITSPSAGTTSAVSMAVTASVSGAASAGGVDRVYFTAGGVDIGDDDTAPFGVTWTPPADGTYRIWARVLLGNGELTDASPVDVVVRQTIVALTKPGPGTDVSGPVHLTAAFANDRTTYLEWLRFYLDGTLIATDPLAPIDVVWDPRATGLGDHTLVAKAFLGDGRVLTSAPRTITVTPPKVIRLAGTDRYSTAAAISRATFDPGVPVAYVATGLDFPDALAGAALAGKRGGPILLTPPGGLPPSTIAELQRLKPATIVVLGGTSVLPGAILEALRGYTTGSVTRIAGSDRYATAAAVSRSGYDPGVAVAYIAIGTNFPDALAGAALAGRDRRAGAPRQSDRHPGADRDRASAPETGEDRHLRRRRRHPGRDGDGPPGVHDGIGVTALGCRSVRHGRGGRGQVRQRARRSLCRDRSRLRRRPGRGRCGRSSGPADRAGRKDRVACAVGSGTGSARPGSDRHPRRHGCRRRLTRDPPRDIRPLTDRAV